MSATTARYGKGNEFDAFAVSLHQCLKRNQRALEAEGMVAELGALVRWTDRVYAGSMTALDALEKYGPESLDNLRNRIELALREQQRAADEFPEALDQEESIQHRYARALRDVSDALERLIEASDSHEFPEAKAPTPAPLDAKPNSNKGEETMKIVTPEADGQQAEAPLDAKSQALVADALARLLASTYSLYVKSLFYHWNVTGPQFIGLHALFEEHYQNLHEAGDELAERIRALGHFTPGTLQAFAALSVVKDDERLPEDAKGMIKNLRAAHELCTKEARRVFEIAEDAGDDVTADIVVARRQFHDKAVWMLGASL